jgi:hypothetical protein
MTPANPTPPEDDEDAEIERRYAELQAKRARQAAKAAGIHTSGGASIGGSVSAGGHVIGRDFFQLIIQHASSAAEAVSAQQGLAHYLFLLGNELACLRLGEIDSSINQATQSPVQLPDIYVPLKTTFQKDAQQGLAQAVVENKKGQLRDGQMVATSALEALAAFPQLTLIGDAGGGKSSFGAHVLLTLVRRWQDQGAALSALGEHWQAGAPLPVRVVLREFAAATATETRVLTAGDVWAFIGKKLEAEGWGHGQQAMQVVQKLVREHGALMLFDGLDECGDQARCDRVLVAVRHFMRNEQPKSRFVLTARPHAFPKGADPSNGVFKLAEFDDEQIELFITQFFSALTLRGWRTEAAANTKRDALLLAYQNDTLRPMAGNPLLLTLMATMHSNGQLPNDRVELYDDTVKLLMQRWNQDLDAGGALIAALDVKGLDMGHLRAALEKLAFQVHAANVGVQGTADIGEAQLVRAFEPLLGSMDKARQVVEFVERRAGLLVGTGPRGDERHFTFPHRTFQEFLAACHLARLEDFPAQCRPLAQTHPDHWRVVLTLAAGLSKRSNGATAADELVGGADVHISPQSTPTRNDWERALLAGLQLQEIGSLTLRSAGARSCAVLGRVQGWLLAGMALHPQQGGLPAAQRAEMGQALAALGDPRFAGPEKFHLPADDMLGFVGIDADPSFCIGTRKADAARVAKTVGTDVDKDDINDALTPTPRFYMSRFAVTVAQFRAFMLETQFTLTDDDGLRDADNAPMHTVTWSEALAYCQWLHEHLLRGPALAGHAAAVLVRQGGWQLTLPSELEWEKAARGQRPQAVFSWGDEPDPERANYSRSGVGRAAPVGSFGPNDFGLHDMLGNVWEWTRSAWQPYPYNATVAGRESIDAASEDSRVVRGGSWYGSVYLARCAFRFGDVPDSRYDGLGFRVVLRSAPVQKR